MNISVIIPTFNRANFLPRAIDSVLKQDFKAWEIIVVDDGSIDNTSDILNIYKHDIKILTQKNKGVSAARNCGIKYASGDWIALLDSDDEWLPHKLAGHVSFIKENPEMEIFQCEEIWIRNGKKVNPKKKHKKYGGWIFEKCLPLCIISPSAVIFKKSLWEAMLGFDERFFVCEDYDFWLRVSRRCPIGLDPNAGILKYGGHTDQLSMKYKKMDQFRVMALEKHIFDPTLEANNKHLVIDEAIKKLKVLWAGATKRNIDGNIWQQKIVKLEKLKNTITGEI